ncbi:MAG: tetratricopeptide repeat protein [Acidimicrobiia bacterium]|nr:tetratricopeptide repeat protein [Acidimicrobiia bacterium]
MRADAVVFAVGGIVFGLIVGWVVGEQQARHRAESVAAVTAAAPVSSAPADQPAVLDDDQVKTLTTIAEQDATNVNARVQLGNLYFDAERFPEAIRWYEAAVELDPKNVDVSTDLGVSYYYNQDPDRALEQFDRSLAINPSHVKTFFNQGIVRAFGKRDLAGATESWERVVDLAPGTPEAVAAQRALDSLGAAHQAQTDGASPSDGQ